MGNFKIAFGGVNYNKVYNNGESFYIGKDEKDLISWSMQTGANGYTLINISIINPSERTLQYLSDGRLGLKMLVGRTQKSYRRYPSAYWNDEGWPKQGRYVGRHYHPKWTAKEWKNHRDVISLSYTQDLSDIELDDMYHHSYYDSKNLSGLLYMAQSNGDPYRDSGYVDYKIALARSCGDGYRVYKTSSPIRVEYEDIEA